MDEKIRIIEKQLKSTMDEMRLMTDDLARMQGELDALKKEVKADEWPKYGDEYYVVSAPGSVVKQDSWDGSNYDISAKSVGNIFRTREEAEERAALLRWLAEDPARWRKIQVWSEICKFADGGEYALYLDKGMVKPFAYCDCSGIPMFSSRDIASECIDKIGADRLKRDWFGVEV